MTKHRKAYRCRIDHSGRIIQLKENCHITTMPPSYTPEEATTYILKEYPNENIIIKSDKGGSPYIRKRLEKNYVGRISVEKDTTKWLRLIKSDGTVWIIRTVGNKHYVGEKIQ